MFFEYMDFTIFVLQFNNFNMAGDNEMRPQNAFHNAPAGSAAAECMLTPRHFHYYGRRRGRPPYEPSLVAQ